LDDRPDKWAAVQAAFEGTGVAPERFPGVRHEVGWKGCGAAHVAVAAEAQRRGLPWVLVLEDDCQPAADFAERWPAVQRRLWETRGEWDIFLGGPTYVQGPARRLGGPSPTLLEIDQGYALHFYVLQASAYSKMQAWEPDRNGPIDVYTSTTFRIVTAYPLLAGQRPSRSDIRKEDTDYSDHFEESGRALRRLLYGIDTRWGTVALLAASAAALVALWRRGGRRTA
jgi:hypothetical protein